MNKSKNKVESKYKNPDRTIAALKNLIIQKDLAIGDLSSSVANLVHENNELSNSVLGEKLFTWKTPDNIKHTAAGLNARQSRAMSIGTKVFMEGKVVSKECFLEPNLDTATMIFNTVYVKD